MKIMIALDGSNLADEAMAPALNLARSYDADLVLVTVLEDSPVEGDEDVLQATSYLDYHKRDLGEDVPCETLVLKGSAPEQLLQCAREHEVDLIAMTPQGRGVNGRWKLGRVADKVMRSAPCPVLMVRGLPSQFKKILVALDGTPGAETALAPASQLARWGQITLVRVAVQELPRFGKAQSVEAAQDARKHQERLVSDYLNNLGKNIEGATVVCHPCEGSPTEQILECCARGTDLVVMTSNSRNWPAQTFFGSVAERVVHNAPCSILLLRGERQLSFKCNEPEAAVAAGV